LFIKQGRDFGMLGKAGGKMRAPAQKEQKQTVTKKMRVANLSSGTTNGMSSSLVFTPIQGLELVNPNADKEQKVKAANAKWFDSSTGFMSARPK
jgi:U4/U6 small nuclear ribonucleoprotein PRP31